MKRYRHYNKKRAIVLSCFGSVIEQQKYLDLQKLIEEKFSDCDVFLSFSSRMVLKHLIKNGEDFKNLPQVLADVDMLGYQHIVVSSINIYPTDEHEFLKKIVNGFNSFSLANVNHTNAILTKTKDTTEFLKELNDQVSQKDTANLYIIHGTPKLDTAGIEAINYTASFLELIGENNYACSLEGAMPYFDIHDVIKAKMKKDGVKKVQVVPLLLVSGNHYIKDMNEIKDDLANEFESSIVPTLTHGQHFNLIELPKIQNIIMKNLEETFKMSGISHQQMTF